MRAVLQRVSSAQVAVDGAVVGRIGRGLCVLACAVEGDSRKDAEFIARKLASLRIFPNDAGRMNRDVRQVGGAVLPVSQFTLAADTTSGARPSFINALEPEKAAALLGLVKAGLEAEGLRVEEGSFGAKMQLELTNDGPVTIILDSQDKRRK